MPAYVISRVSISDQPTMAGYMQDAPESVALYGGKYLVRSGDIGHPDSRSDRRQEFTPASIQ